MIAEPVYEKTFCSVFAKSGDTIYIEYEFADGRYAKFDYLVVKTNWYTKEDSRKLAESFLAQKKRVKLPTF